MSNSELIERIDRLGRYHAEHDGPFSDIVSLLQDCKAALSQQEAEPVAYQCRMRASWNSDQLWTKWEECSKGTFEDYKRAPTNGDWYFESRALYEHPPKPAPLPIEPSPQPVASVPQDSEDSFERWVNTHPGYTYRDVWQAGREYQSWLSVASVPQDVEEFIAEKRKQLADYCNEFSYCEPDTGSAVFESEYHSQHAEDLEEFIGDLEAMLAASKEGV